MNQSLKPAIWLLIFIAILPQFSETVYTPALPDIAKSLKIEEAMVEYTLSIYLLGMAVGSLFWGRLSDFLGRRPCLLYGVLIFISGCIGCFLSGSIEMLMVSRFIQAFGGSTGSILGQSIARDAFKGPERGKIFSLVGSAIAFGPAVGPVLGGMIDEMLGWSYIFILLAVLGTVVFYLSYKNLPETRSFSAQNKPSTISALFLLMVKDKKIWACALMVGGIIGILFSYYSEGSFYLIKMLGLSPQVYGVTFILLAISGTAGGLWAKKLHNSFTTFQIIYRGLKIFITGTFIFVSLIALFHLLSAPISWFIILTLFTMMILTFSGSIIAPNTLSIVLTNYEHATGTASSLFSFFYYSVISLVTFFMGSLHNGTLFPMPIYFFLISICVYFLFSRYLKEEKR